ncbi:MAG: LptE family protein [Chthoniobacteraceae bacterium]
MLPPKPHTAVAFLLSAALLTGCVSNKPLTSVDRTKYGRASIAPDIKLPKSYSYSDATMAGTAAVAGSFGLAGLLVGLPVLVAEANAGKKRVGGAIDRSGVQPTPIFREAFERELKKLNHFQLVSANPDATFKLEILNWGFDSGGAGKLAASLSVRVQLLDRANKQIWNRFVNAVSPTNGTHEQFNADSNLYAKAFREVAEVVARKITGEWE